MTEILKGKVKTVFPTDNPEEVIIQYEDRVTAGNGRKELWVEDKGSVCCEISQVLFEIQFSTTTTHQSTVLREQWGPNPERSVNSRTVNAIRR